MRRCVSRLRGRAGESTGRNRAHVDRSHRQQVRWLVSGPPPTKRTTDLGHRQPARWPSRSHASTKANHTTPSPAREWPHCTSPSTEFNFDSHIPSYPNYPNYPPLPVQIHMFIFALLLALPPSAQQGPPVPTPLPSLLGERGRDGSAPGNGSTISRRAVGHGRGITQT